MDTQDFQKLIDAGEDETIEFKRSTAQTDRALRTICGFLNHKGGTVYFGITDKNELVGQQVSDSTLKSLSQKIRQKIRPETSPNIKVIEINKKKIIEVKVKEGANKPYYLDSIAYKRVGSETPPIVLEELEDLILKKNRHQWDIEVCGHATIDDIDWVFVKEFFIPKYESLAKRRLTGTDKELLEALNCIKNDKPTNAGILLFGIDPIKFLRNAYIAIARYKGKQEGIERLDYREFTGNIFRQIDDCDTYIKEHTTIMSRLTPNKVEREDIPEYCWFSIRELVINCICHRDYSCMGSKTIIKHFKDRIEYYNPGGLSHGITSENITEKQYSKNSVITGVLAKVKYIEDLGEGWNKIIDEHKNHPLQPKMPKVKADRYSILVIIYSVKGKFENGKFGLNERQKKAINYVQESKKITNSEYKELNKTTKKSATRDLQSLVKQNIFLRKGVTGKGVYYTINPTYKGDIRGHKGTL
ncbi:MAG: hypothetical protein GQ477_01935 [Nanohaloarchaea archaeon]|nr:hypothetical protein [Candidatus Nanohaloarchaea archaeon]